jgi:hypothetical protein
MLAAFVVIHLRPPSPPPSSNVLNAAEVVSTSLQSYRYTLTLIDNFIARVSAYPVKAICDFSRSVPGLKLRRPLGVWARECLQLGCLRADRLLESLDREVMRAYHFDALLLAHNFTDDGDDTFMSLLTQKLERDLRRWSGALKRCRHFKSVPRPMLANECSHNHAGSTRPSEGFLDQVACSADLGALLQQDVCANSAKSVNSRCRDVFPLPSFSNNEAGDALGKLVDFAVLGLNMMYGSPGFGSSRHAIHDAIHGLLLTRTQELMGHLDDGSPFPVPMEALAAVLGHDPVCEIGGHVKTTQARCSATC